MEFLKRCKNEVAALYNDCKTEVISNSGKYMRMGRLGLYGCAVASMGISALADDDIAGLGTTIQGIIAEIYSSSLGVVTVLAALLLVIAFIVRMTASQQKAAQATSWIVRIIICYICINCIGLFFTVIDNTTEPYEWNPTDGDTSGAGDAPAVVPDP